MDITTTIQNTTNVVETSSTFGVVDNSSSPGFPLWAIIILIVVFVLFACAIAFWIKGVRPRRAFSHSADTFASEVPKTENVSVVVVEGADFNIDNLIRTFDM
jgi:hypothetical protein